VGAHPDDIEVGAGGTVARLAEQGAEVTMVIVCVPSGLEVRLAEARRAAERLGARAEFLFAQAEMRVEDVKTYELVGRLDGLVREKDPGAVITHGVSSLHQDHSLVHRACVSAQRLHHFDMFCFCASSCHPVSAPFYPQAYVDISGTIDRKMAAIREHRSQFDCRGLTPERYRGVAKEHGRLAGVEYAEGLEVSRLKLG
jgi:LmbE family N-acetylglucosaminyl deacetylase